MFSLDNTIVELHRAFHVLNESYFDGELPTPIITIGYTQNALGHFTPWLSWVDKADEDNESKKNYEINISPQVFAQDSAEILGVLLHEMIHFWHTVNNIKDCSNNRHNKKFKKKAEELGFTVEQSKKYGWGHTSLTDALRQELIELVDPVDEAFAFYRAEFVKPEKEKKPRKKTMFKYTCPLCGLEVKGKRGIEVKCGCSDSVMEMEEEDEEDGEE